MFWITIIAMAVVALCFVLFPIIKGRLSRETLLIIALVTGVPLSGFVGYEIGAYEKSPAQTAPIGQVSETAEISPAPDPAKMVAQLEARLKNGSGTPEEWAMLARSYNTLQRHKDAVTAYAKAAETITNDAQMFADYADALAMSRGSLDKDSEALIDKALKVDPLNPKALALKATVAFNNKDYQAAIDLWQRMLTIPGLNQDWVNGARGGIDEAQSLMSPASKK
jgi:cytochrome c-type biogenesis protein CcmH